MNSKSAITVLMTSLIDGTLTTFLVQFFCKLFFNKSIITKNWIASPHNPQFTASGHRNITSVVSLYHHPCLEYSNYCEIDNCMLKCRLSVKEIYLCYRDAVDIKKKQDRKLTIMCMRKKAETVIVIQTHRCVNTETLVTNRCSF